MYSNWKMELEDLISLCQNGSESEKCVALVKLEKMGIKAKEAVPVIVELLDFPEDGVRSNAASALGKIADKDVGVKLLPLLKDPDSYIRTEAVESLGLLGYAEGVRDIVDLLQTDEDYLVRLCAAEALGNLNDRSAIPALIEALNDPNEGVRAYAADSIGLLGVVEALPILQQKIEFESSLLTRAFIFSALYKIGDEKYLFSLVKMLETVDYSLAITIFNLMGYIATPQNAALLKELILAFTQSRPSLDPHEPLYPNPSALIKHLDSLIKSGSEVNN
jgi:HEAT repeat protein